MIAERIARMDPSPTLQVSARARRMRAEGIDIVDLSAGQPDFPTPEHIKQAACKAIADNQTRYTDNEGIPELREAIAHKLKTENGVSYSPADIIVSCGAKQSLYNACLALVNKGDDVLIPSPYWVSYPAQVALAEGNAVYVPRREANDFVLTVADLEAKLTRRSKLIFINTPCNPTGAVYSAEQLAELCEFAVARGLWLLLDEIYEKLVYDGVPHVCPASLSERIKERTIVINGVSKSYAMTGWRIGYAAGPSEVINAMKTIQSHSTSNTASISQYAALAAIAGPQDDMRRMTATFQRRRDVLFEGLQSLPGLRVNRAKGAFYLFCNIEGLFGKQHAGKKISNSADFAAYLLEAAHVAAVAGEAFGAPSYVRFSYATSTEQLEKAVVRIRDAILKLA
ncbi:MAG: pyridoxal phosphate-dependent aminotransferase [Planctomycetota bacterium]